MLSIYLINTFYRYNTFTNFFIGECIWGDP